MIQPQSFEDVLNLHPDDFARCDIALVNLLCATGLPGSEELDIPACLAKVNSWTEEVREETNRNLRTFLPRPPLHTTASIRCWTLCKLLGHRKGLHHHLRPENEDPTKQYIITGCTEPGPKSSFRSSEPVFLHGLLGNRKTGSCTSFPVLFTAVGRRLGYPIKLVLSVAHMFIRWDDPADTFNMDRGETYINRHPDNYYLDKPKPWTEEERDCGVFLRPVTPTEELAEFVGLRAAVFHANFRMDEAIEMCDLAHQLFPSDPLYPKFARRIEQARIQRFMEADGWGYEPDEAAHTQPEGSASGAVIAATVQTAEQSAERGPSHART